MPTWIQLRVPFTSLWPGVHSEGIYWILRDHDRAAGHRALVEQALALGGREAATLLMAPLAATLHVTEGRDRARVLHGLDALVRAGGDPTAALATMAAGAEDERSRRAATDALRRAALKGWPLEEVREHLERLYRETDDLRIRSALRVGFFAHGARSALLDRLDAVYRVQRVGNLRDGIGLVEELLYAGSADDVVLAEQVLAALTRAGPDLHSCWLGLLPVLERHLTHPDPRLRAQAARALGQVRHTHRYAGDLDEAQAARAVVGALEQTLPALTLLLADPDGRAAAAAAEAVRIFAEHGASLAAVWPRVEAALDDGRVDVRSASSIALSTWHQRTGREAPLAAGQSHRRTYARSDTPIDDRAPRTCGACGAVEVRVVCHHDDGKQFYATTTTERHCAACGLYTVWVFQAPG